MTEAATALADRCDIGGVVCRYAHALDWRHDVAASISAHLRQAQA